MKSRRLLCLSALLLLVGLRRADAAPSLLLSNQPGWNGWSVSTTIKAGFREHGGPGERAVTRTAARLITAASASPGESFPLTPPGALFTPDSGDPKDKAQAQTSITYLAGGASSADSFSFNIAATTSAVNARHSFGAAPVPADAFVECEIILETFGPLTGASLRLPAIPSLTAAAPSIESLTATASGPVSGFFLPGYAETDFPLTLAPSGAAGRFRYVVSYSIVTPFGADPVVSYHFEGAAATLPPAPAPPLTPSEDSVRREAPVVVLNNLIYPHQSDISATVRFQNAADIAPHNLIALVCPDTGDFERLQLSPSADPLVHLSTSIPIDSKLESDPQPMDGVLSVKQGSKFTAIYAYRLSQRITPDATKGLKPTEPFISSDWGMAAQNPDSSPVKTFLTSGIAMSGPAEENPPKNMRRTGTLGVEGLPGILQIASDELIFHPRDAAQAAAFASRAGAVKIDDDAAWKGGNSPPVWHRYRMLDTPAAEAARQARIPNLAQLYAATGRTGKLHGSNPRVLGLFATALELWLEGFNCAVNPRALVHDQLSAPEAGAFDSMLVPNLHMDDPRQNLRDLWAHSAMMDLDARTVRVAFIDSAFAPNPDFRGFPDSIPQFNMETGLRGPHVAEFPEAPIPIRSQFWHGNGTVAVAAGVMGNRFGFAGIGGQIIQPYLYYMGTETFAFEMGRAMQLAVSDGADVINISAGYPCRILSVLGPIRICSESDRAAVAGTVAGLVATSVATICAAGSIADFFLPGASAIICGSASVAGTTAVGALFNSLFLSSAIGDPRHAMEEGVETARLAGVPVIASAGNQINWDFLGEWASLFDTANARSDDWEQVPAVIPDVISCSSVPPEAPYPNTQLHGPSVDLWAPEGQAIMVPVDPADPSPANVRADAQTLTFFFGSSAAAPFVSGVISHMMAANPSLQRSRATPAERATLVARLTSLLRSSASLPGSAPDLPASSPTDPEIARRGPLVNAFAALEAAIRAIPGGITLAETGFPTRFARFDDEGPVASDSARIKRLVIPTSGTILEFGGLTAGDLDTWEFALPTPGVGVPRATVQIAVPIQSGPPPYLLNGDSIIPRISTSGGLALYQATISRCEDSLLRLRCPGRIPPGGSLLRRDDILYLISASYAGAVTESSPDSYESASQPNNITPANVSPSLWQPLPGPFAPACAEGSHTLSLPNQSLSGCRDEDLYRLNPWPGYDPTAADCAILTVSLDPPQPGAYLQFQEEVSLPGGASRREFTGPAVRGNESLSINAAAHPLPLILRLTGVSPARYRINVRYCIFDQTFCDSLTSSSRARIKPGSLRAFWENRRDSLIFPVTGPVEFGPRFTSDMATFNYPRDKDGRSQYGQLFLIENSKSGPLRVLARPANSSASLRLDLFSLDGKSLGAAATDDLAGDPDLDTKQLHPKGDPLPLESSDQPAGTYILAVSGFHFTDAWSLLFGELQSSPGLVNAEGAGNPTPLALDDAPLWQPAQSGAQNLQGTPFALSIIPGAQLTFIPPLGGYRAEYSSDGQSWSEAAPASDLLMFPASISLPLPINPDGTPGFLRVRSLRDRAELPPYVLFQSYQPQFLAAPTEPGHSYSLQSSKDLSEWSSDTPVTADGSVLTWPLPTWEDHNFFRISRN